MHTRLAGVFLFVPLLVQVGFDRLVRRAAYPGSNKIPEVSALLSLLALKLLDKERRSHINDFNFDEALGLFAGLNVLPKKSFATDYSYRTDRGCQERLLSGWVGELSALLFPEARRFALDFHPIPHRGEGSGLENHFVPMRGRPAKSVQTLFVQEQDSRVLCYANANLTRSDQPAALMRFIDWWHALSGSDPEWLYFDSKLVPYAELSRVNQRGVSFVTIRRRGPALLRRLAERPAADWQTVVIDIPKRRHQRIHILEEPVTLTDYDGLVRQVAAKNLGRQQPTLFLSNNFSHSARELLTGYAYRNRVEDGLGDSVNFFHLDCLSSDVRLNVDLDATLTVLANGCYRWLASRLKGFDQAKPKQLFRKFVETSGTIAIEERTIVVSFDRRAHNPIIREANLVADGTRIPWLGGYRLRFEYK